MLDDGLHEGSCCKRGVRLPLCSLRSILIIGHATDEAERFLPATEDALNHLIELSVTAEALMPGGEVLTTLLFPFQHFAVEDGSTTDDRLVAVQVWLHLFTGGLLRVSNLDDGVPVHVDEEAVGVRCRSREILLLLCEKLLSILDVLLPRAAVLRIHLVFVDELVGNVLDDGLWDSPAARLVASASFLLVKLHALTTEEHHAVGVGCRDDDVPKTTVTVEVVGLWHAAADADHQHMLNVKATT